MPNLIDIFANAIFIKPRLNLTQWSGQFRILSKESSAHYGKFKSNSYQIEPMNAISNPKIRKVVLLWASQLGKSEILNNTIGYFIHQEPSTLLFVLPNENDAEDYSKRRLAPMFRDTKCLNKLLYANDANNTILIKNFKGGNLALVGSNSVSKLSSKPIKVVLFDEVDRYEGTKEGDPIKLAEKRTITFTDRKIVISSTPTLKGSSTIENEFNKSDKCFFYVPCPHCGHYQTLDFARLTWEKDEEGKSDPGTAKYTCSECGSLINEQEKNEMVKRGQWRATEASEIKGFFLNALYSPFYTLSDIAEDFLSSKDDASTLQTFVNTIKAESFEPPSVSFDNHELYNRKESYTKDTLPNNIDFITAGVDVQNDRVEVNFIGWGVGLEAYNIIHQVIAGDTAKSEVWAELYNVLLQPFTKQNKSVLNSSLCLIDSGFRAEEVYDFVKQNRRFIATKGLSETSLKADFIGTLKRQKGANFLNIGTYKGKSELFRLLQIKQQGEGYFHFSAHYELEFFMQLTAEKVQKVRTKNGYKKLQWVKIRERNEALDISVLALAGAKLLKQKKKKRKKVVVK